MLRKTSSCKKLTGGRHQTILLLIVLFLIVIATEVVWFEQHLSYTVEHSPVRSAIWHNRLKTGWTNRAPLENQTVYPRPYHLGCWLQTEKHGRFPGTSMIKPAMTVNDCIQHCRRGNHTYAGIKNGVECWCNSTIGDYIPSHACTESCPGDRRYMCGGKTSMNVYVVNEVQTKYEFSGEPRKLLIVAYMRTGSTFVSELFNQHPDSFYIFEPFFRIGYPHPSIIQHLFTCQFERVPSDILYRQFGYWHGHMQYTFGHFFTCMYKVGVGGFHRCIALLKIVCQQASLRVVKEIEINMSSVVLMKELLPDLKVIHLVRDPRAVTFSRIRVQERNTPKHASKFCQDVASDLKMAKKLPPHDLYSLKYEVLAEHPFNVARVLYKFIELSVTPEVFSWMERATGIKNACVKIVCKLAYSTIRNNSAETAYKWKASIPFKVVRFVDSECSQMYARLGYLPIQNENDLRNPKLRHRTW